MARVLRWVPAILWMGVIFYGSSQSVLPIDGQPNSGSLHKLGHVVEYAVLGVLLVVAMGVSGRSLALGFVLATIFAISDEVHQTFVPGRQGAVDQVVLDAAVVAVTLGTIRALVRPAHQAAAKVRTGATGGAPLERR